MLLTKLPGNKGIIKRLKDTLETWLCLSAKNMFIEMITCTNQYIETIPSNFSREKMRCSLAKQN